MNSDNPEDVLSLFLGPKSNALGASLIALEVFAIILPIVTLNFFF